MLENDFQLNEVLNIPSNIRQTAKFIINCFDERSKVMANIRDNGSYYHTDPKEECVLCNLENDSLTVNV